MRRICSTFFLLIILLFSGGCERDRVTSATPPAAVKTPSGIILAMGDSLTAGLGVAEEWSYPAQLTVELGVVGENFRVINGGISGETTSGALSRLDWLLTMKPDIIILETGANDGMRGIDPGLAKKNILAIIHRLQQENIIVILTGMKMLTNLGPAYTESFNRIYPEIARETGVIFMPFFLEGVAADPALNIDDGIHPNPQGYRIIVDNLFPFVTKAIEQRKKTAVPQNP